MIDNWKSLPIGFDVKQWNKRFELLYSNNNNKLLESKIELLNDHPTNNNEQGINMKRKHQAIAQNLLQKNSPPWGKFSGDTKGVLILPGSV